MHKRSDDNPYHKQHATHHAQNGIEIMHILARHVAQKEQAQHATAEDGRKHPPRFERALHVEEGYSDQNAQHTDQQAAQLQYQQLFLVGSVLAEALVIVGQDDGGRAGHTRSHGAHAGGKDGSYKQSCHTHRKLMHNEVGEHIVSLLSNIRRKQVGIYLIICIQCSSDEEEYGRHGDVQIAAEECGEFCFTLALGREVTLHIVLVNAIILQVNKETIYQTYPQRGRVNVRREVPKVELVVLHGYLKRLHRPFRHLEQEHEQTHHRTAYKDESLHRFRPNDSLHTSHHGVDDDGNARHHNDQGDVPAHEAIHRQCQQEEDGTHTGNLRQEVTHRGIHACPRAETFLQETISRHTPHVAIERHEVFGRKIRSHGNGQAEHKRIPVSGKSHARITQITDTAHVGGKDGHADHPTGQTASG